MKIFLLTLACLLFWSCGKEPEGNRSSRENGGKDQKGLGSLSMKEKGGKENVHAKASDPSVHADLSAETLFEIGMRHFNAKKYEDALGHFNLGIKKYPDHPEFFDARASVYVERKEFSKALADREKAVSLSPDNPGFLVNRAFLYFKFGRYDAGMKDLDEAISLDPLYFPAHFLKGRMFAGKKRFREALKEYQLCEKADPRIAKTYGTRAFVYWAMGNSEQALADMKKYAEMVKDPGQKEMAVKVMTAWKSGAKNGHKKEKAGK